MRNPGRWLRIAMGAVLAGIAALACAFLLPQAWAGDPLRVALALPGLMAVVFGGWGVVVTKRALMAELSLDRGEDVIARWHVDADSWRRFSALESRLRQRDATPNELGLADETAAPNGVDIVIGKDAVRVGDSIHNVPRRGTPEILDASLVQDDPDYIVLELLYPAGGRGASGLQQQAVRAALRFPVSPKAWRDARNVVANFRGLLPQEADFFHGKGDGSDPEDLNTCAACGYQSHRYMSRCPQCGGGMLTRRWGRRFGAVIAVCGAIVTGIMAAVMYYNLRLLLHPGTTIDGSRFNGGWPMAMFVLAIFLAVLTFGVAALGYGVWQMVTGRRSWAVVRVLVTIWTILMTVAWGISRFGG